MNFILIDHECKILYIGSEGQKRTDNKMIGQQKNNSLRKSSSKNTLGSKIDVTGAKSSPYVSNL